MWSLEDVQRLCQELEEKKMEKFIAIEQPNVKILKVGTLQEVEAATTERLLEVSAPVSVEIYSLDSIASKTVHFTPIK